MDVYVGIDVACAKGKALSICFVTQVQGSLRILNPRSTFLRTVPRGLGNREILSGNPFHEVAKQTALAFQTLTDQTGWRIRRIAIDAPAAPATEGRRQSEIALKQSGLQCIWTPDNAAWKDRIDSARKYLNNGGALARLPGANEIWMLYGFALFKELRKVRDSEVIEVFPYAIMRTLLPTCPHKSLPEGYSLQLNAVATAVGSTSNQLEDELGQAVLGAKHDRLDAYMAAWVASLTLGNRRAFGSEANLDDAIWVPQCPI
jgi:Protein of unknown function (DUF429)